MESGGGKTTIQEAGATPYSMDRGIGNRELLDPVARASYADTRSGWSYLRCVEEGLMSRFTRRRFLAVSTAAVGLAGGAAPRPAWGAESQRTGRAFGTTVRLQVLHSDARRADEAAEAGLAELLRLESLLSLYRPDSAVSQLNRQGYLDRPPRELVTVLRAATRMSQRSDGAFDVTVQPLWVLYAEQRRSGRSPTPEQLAEARRHVDWRAMVVDERRVAFTRPGMSLTLNGIAQGYVTDGVRQVLQEHGVVQALLDTGEIGTLGKRTSTDPWRIGIQHPRDDDAYVALAQLAGRCLATSGDYATRWSDDYASHHVFDPRTGASPQELASVSIVAPTAMEADALSTAVMVLGPEAGMSLVAETPAAAVLLVTKAGRVLASPGFPLAES